MNLTRRGTTAVLSADQARVLLDSIDTSHLIGLRDRAFVGLMIYSFAEVSAMTEMCVEDYYLDHRRRWVRLHEKGGTRRDVRAHQQAAAYLDAYLDAAGIRGQRRGPLFRTVGGDRRLSDRPMHRTDVLRMIKRRAQAAGLPASTCCHTLRATGITVLLASGFGKTLRVAGHAFRSPGESDGRPHDTLLHDAIDHIII